MGELLDKLTEERFLDFVDDFTAQHCDKFEEGEQKLEYTDIHNQVRDSMRARSTSNRHGGTYMAYVESKSTVRKRWTNIWLKIWLQSTDFLSPT